MKWVQGLYDPYGFEQIKHGNDIWVAGNLANGIYYSCDGKTWTHSSTGRGSAGKISDICYANGLWVATGSANMGGASYSLEGKYWITSGLEAEVNCVNYGNGIWVLGMANSTGLRYSTTGKTWTTSNITSGNFKKVHYANGIWVAGSASNRGLYYSTDGKNWIQSNLTTGQGYDIAYANGIWIVGFYSRRGSYRTGIYYSTDGKSWTQSNLTSSNDYSAPCFMFNKWVIGEQGGGSVYYSTDGKTWTKSNMSGYTFTNGACANGIALLGATGYNSGNIFYSFDGKTWNKGATMVDNAVSQISVDNLYNANGLWVAATSAGLYYSPTWEAPPVIIAEEYVLKSTVTTGMTTDGESKTYEAEFISGPDNTTFDALRIYTINDGEIT